MSGAAPPPWVTLKILVSPGAPFLCEKPDVRSGSPTGFVVRHRKQIKRSTKPN
jgi:hypothetical protein